MSQFVYEQLGTDTPVPPYVDAAAMGYNGPNFVGVDGSVARPPLFLPEANYSTITSSDKAYMFGTTEGQGYEHRHLNTPYYATYDRIPFRDTVVSVLKVSRVVYKSLTFSPLV